jgi:hypothetical protein
MPFSMPMWPLLLDAPVPIGRPADAGSAIPLRRSWVIVEEAVRREVDEREYRAALASCTSVEATRDPDAGIITTAYRTP